MATWDPNTARTSLRSLLADGETDKIEFKIPTYPVPDGVTTTFALGRTRVIGSSLKVYVNGADVQPSAMDEEPGTVTLATPPSPSGVVLASFHYQWFSDHHLDQFLQAGMQLLGFDAAADVTPTAVRPICLDFAAYHAYMHKAAEFAEELVVSAGGYTAHQYRSHPNWRELAKLSFEQGQAKLKIYLENPLGVRAPSLAFSAFCLAPYQPRS